MSTLKFNNKEEVVYKIEKQGCSTVYYGSPFFGAPEKLEADPYFLMDTNIFNHICKNDYPETVSEFIQYAKSNFLELNPAFAIAELYRTSKNPRGYLDYYQKHLNNEFGISITGSSLDDYCALVESLVPVMKSNIELIEEYLVIIKEIYNSSLSEEKSIENLLNLIKDKNLPQFAFVIFTGLTFLFVKHNVKNNESIRKRVDSFLSIGRNYDEEKRNLHNGASDISIFLNAKEIAANSGNLKCTLANVVTRDLVVAYLLDNLCIYSVTPIVKGNYSGQITPRNTSEWMHKFEQYKDLIMEKLDRNGSGTADEITTRRANLKKESSLSLDRYLKSKNG